MEKNKEDCICCFFDQEEEVEESRRSCDEPPISEFDSMLYIYNIYRYIPSNQEALKKYT